eukprot:Gregarina_sp_Poly_1__11149@NODE_905_length_5764_cov_9_157627_g645_i0_p1_GENE_NODE_905_length_5764_cov_9_157627_g645_i0NODE_905_length_5764_cov_9_157627_g645_i0_p1_ORF_typecomplete_len660_score56_53PDEase_I/PF00233_19/2_8e11TMEM237/PF15383_6/0_76_NODE_905_length_5764_cov_9_157627_g645_i0751982
MTTVLTLYSVVKLIQELLILDKSILSKGENLALWIVYSVSRILLALVAWVLPLICANTYILGHCLETVIGMVIIVTILNQTIIYEGALKQNRGVLYRFQWCFQPLAILEGVVLVGGPVMTFPVLARHAVWYTLVVSICSLGIWLWRLQRQQSVTVEEYLSLLLLTLFAIGTAVMKVFHELVERASFLSAETTRAVLASSNVVHSGVGDRDIPEGLVSLHPPPAYRVLTLLQLASTKLTNSLKNLPGGLDPSIVKLEHVISRVEKCTRILTGTTDLYAFAKSKELDEAELEWWRSLTYHSPYAEAGLWKLPSVRQNPMVVRVSSVKKVPVWFALHDRMPLSLRQQWGEDLSLNIIEVYERYPHSMMVDAGVQISEGTVQSLGVDVNVAANLFWTIQCLHFEHPWNNKDRGAHALHLGVIFLKVMGLFESSPPPLRMGILLSMASRSLCHGRCHRELWPFVNARLSCLYNFEDIPGKISVSLLMKLLTFEQCNVFCNLSPQDFLDVRRCIMTNLIGLDVQDHFRLLWKLRVRYQASDWDPLNSPEDRGLLCGLAVRASDLTGDLEVHPNSWMILCRRRLHELLGEGDYHRHLGGSPFVTLDRQDHIGWVKAEALYRELFTFPLVSLVVEMQTSHYHM